MRLSERVRLDTNGTNLGVGGKLRQNPVSLHKETGNLLVNKRKEIMHVDYWYGRQAPVLTPFISMEEAEKRCRFDLSLKWEIDRLLKAINDEQETQESLDYSI